jgi:hypothetical protein
MSVIVILSLWAACLSERCDIANRSYPGTGQSGSFSGDCELHATAAEIHRRSAFNDPEFVIAPARFASHAEEVQVLARGTRSTSSWT